MLPSTILCCHVLVLSPPNRKYGNLARFIRRSCVANSEVSALTGKEVVMPFLVFYFVAVFNCFRKTEC